MALWNQCSINFSHVSCGVLYLLTRIELGLDFTGGVVSEVQVDHRITSSELTPLLEAGLGQKSVLWPVKARGAG